jgi:sulfur relay protein TusB/DsrH
MNINQHETSLHTLNKSNLNTLLNEQLSQCIQTGDSVILIEDGVYQYGSLSGQSQPSSSQHAKPVNTSHWSQIAACIYILEADAIARGIQALPDVNPKVVFIDYREFVNLTLKYKKVVSWY